MQLIILGTKVANAIKNTITPTVDNVKITIFPSMDEFANAAELRNIQCDRLIFTEEIVTGATVADKRQHLQNFRTFLDSRYMDITIISITKSQETLNICSDVFYDPNCLNICITGKVKPACMLALANEQIPKLEEMFSANTIIGFRKQEEQARQDKLEEIENDPNFAVAEQFKQKPEQQTAPKKSEKKGGLFGFGKKKPVKEQEQINVDAFMDDFDNPANPVEEAPVAPVKVGRRKPAGFGGTKRTEDNPVIDDFEVNQNSDDFDDFDDFDNSNQGFDDNNQGFDDSNQGFADFDDTSVSNPCDDNFDDFDDFVDTSVSNQGDDNFDDFDDFDSESQGTQSADSFDDFDTESQDTDSFDDFNTDNQDSFDDFNTDNQDTGSFDDFDTGNQDTDSFDDFDTGNQDTESQDTQSADNFDDFDTDNQDSFDASSQDDFDSFDDVPEESRDDFDAFDIEDNVEEEQDMRTNDITPDFSDSDFDFDVPAQPVSKPQNESKGNNMRQATKRSHGGDFRTVGDADMELDLSAMGAYEEARRPVKVVEKEVIKEVVREVRVPQTGSVQMSNSSRFQNIMNGNLSAIFVISGDRRSGVTKTALTIANTFAKNVPTLFVDLDTVRHGSLYYLGLEDLSDSETAVQNGLGLLKSGRDVKRYVFKSPNFKFDSIVSMPGSDLQDKDLLESLSQLAYQTRQYKVIVIDCPFENLYLTEELMYSADFFFCVDSDICACSNTLFKLDALQSQKAEQGKGVSDKALALMYNRAKYIVKVTGDSNEVINNMSYLEKIYGLSDDKYNWAKLGYAGTIDNIDTILTNLM